MRIFKIGLTVVALGMLTPGLAEAQQKNWLVAPYIWMSDVSWDIAARGSGTVEFSNIVDKLDGAGLIRVEYVNDKFGLTFDYVGMSLSDNRRFATPGPMPIDISIRANVDLTMFEAGAFYRPSATDSGFDFLAGLRATEVDSYLIVTPADAQPQRFDTSSSFTDIYAGARYLHRFTEAWDATIRADYGVGGSDGSLNFLVSVGWRSRGTFGMSLAYRHLTFDVDERIEGEAATNEFDFTGPALGFMFRF
jgi:hypothetical protein